MKKVIPILFCLFLVGCRVQEQPEPVQTATFTVIYQGYKYEHLRRSNFAQNTFIRENGKQIVFGGNYMAVQE